MTDDELLVILKHGTRGDAILHWWGRIAKPDELWELNIVQHWQNPKVPILKFKDRE